MKKENKVKLDIQSVFLAGKVPPHAKDIEASIIGTIILNSDLIYVARDILSEDDFYVKAHKILFSIIIEIQKENKPEILLIAQKVIEKGLSDEIGGIYSITKITDKICSDVNLKNYCLIVKQKAVQRKLIEFGAEILSKAGEEGEDVFDIIQGAETVLLGINKNLSELNTVSNLEVGMMLLDKFDDRVYKAQNNIVDKNAIYTQIPEWDEVNGALFPGLYVVAGRPGMGKGVHLTELICRMGKHYDIGVINGEMTDEQLMKRVGCNIMGIDNFLFKKDPKTVTKQEQELLHDAIGQAINLKFKIENSTNIHKIATRIRGWVLNNNVKCVLADFLTLFKVPSEMKRYYSNKTQEVDYVLEIFRDLCKELNIPIILYAQMNREILGRHGTKKPNLADLKQSGSIEELAFQVSFLHRPEYYDETLVTDEMGESIKGLMYQIIAKHRDGITKDLKLKVDLSRSQLKSWDNTVYINPDGNMNDLPF